MSGQTQNTTPFQNRREEIHQFMREKGIKAPSRLAEQGPGYVARQIKKLQTLDMTGWAADIQRRVRDVLQAWESIWNGFTDEQRAQAQPPKYLQRLDLDALLHQHGVRRPERTQDLTREGCAQGQAAIDAFLAWITLEAAEGRSRGLSEGQTRLLHQWREDWDQLKRWRC